MREFCSRKQRNSHWHWNWPSWPFRIFLTIQSGSFLAKLAVQCTICAVRYCQRKKTMQPLLNGNFWAGRPTYVATTTNYGSLNNASLTLQKIHLNDFSDQVLWTFKRRFSQHNEFGGRWVWLASNFPSIHIGFTIEISSHERTPNQTSITVNFEPQEPLC